MNLDLPATGTEQPPLFTDLAQCSAWIKTLPLSSPMQSQAFLLRELRLLDRYTLADDVRLSLLEALRETIHFVQTESAKKFSGKPMPLAPPEQMAFDASHNLWQALIAGYLRCLDAGLKGVAALKPQIGTICQRALATLMEDQADILRAGTQPDNAHWQLAHLLYASAETQGQATTAGADALRAGKPVTAAAAYAEIMLAQAANLHELTPRHQIWVLRWARRWADKITILCAPPVDSPALPLCVDLAGAAPASFRPYSGTSARWLDTSELRKSLKKRITLLEKGDPQDTPLRLGLGDDCQQPVCGEVLRRIYPRWVKGGVQRRFERHPMSGACGFVVGVDAIHYYVADHQPFKAPGNASTEELRRQRDELATFGRIAERFEDEYSRNHGFQLENWEVVEDWGLLDQSSGGLRLVRPLRQAGGRIGLGQLVAVRPADTRALLLGTVRWAQVGKDSLAAGIKMFPGQPVPVAVRGTGVMAGKEQYRPGFVLPPVEALDVPASVVLPPGSYKPIRVMEVWHAGHSRRLKLREVLDRGADFERVSFEELSA